jgi:hypothetical protein
MSYRYSTAPALNVRIGKHETPLNTVSYQSGVREMRRSMDWE